MPPFPTEDLQDRDLSHQLFDNFMTSSSPSTGYDYYSQGPSSDNFSFADLPNDVPASYGLPIPPIPSLLQTMLASTSPPSNPVPPLPNPAARVSLTPVRSVTLEAPAAVVLSAIGQHPASPIEPTRISAPTSPATLHDARSSAISSAIPHPISVPADHLTSQAGSKPMSEQVGAKKKTATGMGKKTATRKRTATKTGQPELTSATDSNTTGKKRKRAQNASIDSEQAVSKELESVPIRPKPRPVGKSRKTLNETDINAGGSVQEEQTAQRQSRQRKPSAKSGVVLMWEQEEQERMARKKAKVTK
ncbi:hypothetical protein Hypma_010820 [Hypsizygus marmoreus]|uniref:Uncharacterized protein n=1 Tax=Hypsizygus marmoreus TaxID=39966 RepID=A0A369JQJ3_HYPMA|nr:hypothetical protein Hypma_010820 [Hypsizygus marmoreus]